MRCVVVSAVYPPEPVTSARTSADVAQALADKGHEVAVLAPFPNRPAGILHPEYSRRLYRKQRERNVTVIRCFSTLSHRSRLASRVAENVTFGATSALRLATMRRPSVIYSNSWPVFASGAIALVARARGIPVVFAVQDLYPESLSAQRRINERSNIARALRWIDRRVLHAARSVIVISRRFADALVQSRGVDRGRISVIPNWSRAARPATREEMAALRDSLGLPASARVIAFGGSLSPAAGVGVLIEAAALLRDDNLRFVIAGEGSERVSLQALATRRGLGNVVFHAPWAVTETAPLLGMADVLVLPTAPGQSEASVPSKLISYLLSGRPIIAAVGEDSDTAEVIRESGAGWCVEPARPDLLAEHIERALALTASERDRIGAAGRQFALRHFTTEVCLPAVISTIEAAGNGTGH